MNRTNRIAIFAAGVLILAIGGTVLATRTPAASSPPARFAASQEPQDQDEADAPPTADEIAHAVDRLQAHGFATDAAALGALAESYGLGGAVRLTAWSTETGMTVAELAAKRDSGMGWGQIAHELGVHPGIGSIMGNANAAEGHGRDNAPGQSDGSGD
jgi:hypothetical protein